MQSSFLAMGILDSISDFLDKREGDFVKLEGSGTEFGPGPLLLLYNVPEGIEGEEIQDMLSDGAPNASRKQCRVYRLTGDDNDLLDLDLRQSLETILSMANNVSSSIATSAASVTKGVPVLFFSGFQNDEMMEMCNIVGQEVYQETGGGVTPACAKAVPNAMEKPLRQVLDEISDDHIEAFTS